MQRFIPAGSSVWRIGTPILAAVLLTLAGCTDQSGPTNPAADITACASGVTTNTGECAETAPDVTVNPSPGVSSAPGVAGVEASATFTSISNPDASWTGSTTLIDISGISNFTNVNSVSDAVLTVSFSSTMKKGQVVGGDASTGGWRTWSSPPDAETATPHVLATGTSTTSLTLTLSDNVLAFGFEIESNRFTDPENDCGEFTCHSTSPFTFTVTFKSGTTTVGTVTREVHGYAGARLIAARSSVPFDQVTISVDAAALGFAIAQVRYSFAHEDAGGSTRFVPANQEATVTFKDENGDDVAGVDIPANSFDEDVIVNVRFVDDGQPCHESLFLQVGRCLEITIKEVAGGGDATPDLALTIGLCAPTTLKGGRDLFEFKARDSRPIALEEVPEFFIDCPPTFASAGPSGWLQKFASGLVNRVGGWFGATPLLAAVDDDGFGGSHPPGEAFSTFFTWASQVQISDAGLVVNVFNSGKDAFGVEGSFDFSGTAGFAPSAHDVTVGFGKTLEETILKGSFKRQGSKFVYKNRTTEGIAYMEIHPDGTFGIAGSAPTEATTFRPFSLLIGQKLASTYRTQGVGLECAANGRCTVHPDP